MLVLLDGGLQPLLTMLGEVIVGEERYCKWKIESGYGIGVLC